ncbi:LysR family transcriptional regulator [Ruegeria arenilitoris]|uniref:LysR family transcriptional regulator n=1 Tax=Ruegeria arenilitoris TaxID=1173585 RepID=UPI00147B41AA|nr:LysR family transcriptional regulator [Ruegeria arenilitoris]
MDFSLLRTFLAVAEQGGFAAAAQKLGTVQSNVTHRIARMEEQYGQKLFTRGRGGAQLTPFGEIAHLHLDRLSEEIRSVESNLNDIANGSGNLRLGAMETTASSRLPTLLKDLREACPDARLSLTTGPTAQLMQAVWKRELDAAFVAGPVDENRFRATPAFEEELVIASSKNLPSDPPYLVFPVGCHYRATTETWLRSIGKPDTELLEMGTFDGILGCVAAEIGCAVAPRNAFKNSLASQSLELSPLPQPYCNVSTSLIMRNDYIPVRAATELLHLLTSEQ